MTFDDVVALALALPATERTTSYGTPAVKVGARPGTGKLLVRLREDGDMVLVVEDGLREALLEHHADVFHTTPHYAGYPMLLVRLAAADPDQIARLLARAWERQAPARVLRTHGRSPD